MVRRFKNYQRGAWACAGVGSGFTSSKGIAQAFLRDLGAEHDDVEFMPAEPGHGPWITGRGSLILIKGKEIGEFGEIAPEVSGIFGIKSPIQAGEIDLERVRRLIPDPVS